MSVDQTPPERPRPRTRHRRVLLAILVLGGLLLPITGEAATVTASGSGCAGFHSMGFLTGFPTNVGSFFYAGPEGGTATARIGVTPGCSDSPTGTQPVNVHYVREAITATAPEDFEPGGDQTGSLCADQHGPCGTPQQDVTIVLPMDDGSPEPAIETFQIRITGTTPPVTPPGFVSPSSVPVYVIDRDGAARATFEPGAAYSSSETFPRILIPVFLAGPGGGVVPYTLAPDPAAPATPGEDFQDVTGGLVSVNAQQGYGFIQLDIVNDQLGEAPETVTIHLGGAVDGTGSATLTIIDNEENVFPKSRFHHPRNRWKYNKADFRIREFHIFATDEGGSGVVAAELALRRNLKNGKCAWKAKKGWQKKDCQNREWLPTKYDDVGELFYYRMKQLKSSVKTKIKNYTAFARAIDGAGNVEKEFSKKRNMNTFEIKRRGKTQKR